MTDNIHNDAPAAAVDDAGEAGAPTAAVDVKVMARREFELAGEQLFGALTRRDVPIDPTASLRTEVTPTSAAASMLGLPSYHLVDSEHAELVTDDGHATLIVHDTIGAGGMGTVDAATQRSLGREVAVKTTLPEQPQLAASLVSEATITGRLQHPNVVPVYDLARSDDGAPMLVMKRVEGRTWKSVLLQRPVVGSKPWRGWLDAQLRVLMQICNAVAFAHSRGFVHRDLKPDNVMVGEFGEVYVLDWGLAMRVRSDDGARIHRPGDPRNAEGTLAYMSPDQIGATPGGITEQTDVYLLGACLHRLLTGRPPHAAKELSEVVQSITLRKPREYEPEVPRELAAIAQ